MRTTLLIAALSACVAISPLPAPGQVVASASPLLQKAEKKSPGADSGARSLKEVLQEFKKHYAIDILFFNSMVEGVEVPAKDIRLEENPEKSLRALLQNSGLTYKKSKNGGYVIVARKRREDAVLRQSGEKTIGNFPVSREIYPVQPGISTPETEVQRLQVVAKTIKGKVTDEQGEPLPGVSILIKGTQQGLITDTNGEFSIEIPDENAVLIFSFVGYIPREIPVGASTSIEISLKADEKTLEELVVVGYGTQKKTSVTAAVASMKGEEIAGLPVTNLSNGLGGRMAGVITKDPGNLAGMARAFI